jgi:hypothetical protein
MRHFSLSRLSVILALGAALVIVTASGAQAATSFFNGFETDTTGWTNNGGTITQVASGDSSTTYASGVNAATDTHYARLGKEITPGSCVNGGGTQPIYSAPYTQWGGYEATFPTNGYSTSVDIYLDVLYANANADTRFDWSSAISNSSGTAARRDFVFNVATETGGFVIAGSTNANRCGADPASNTAAVHVTASGWYTFKHTFTNQGGVLSVSLQLIDKSTNSTVHTWVLSDASDTIGPSGTVGGHRYGWFVQNEFDGLAIDNSKLSGLAPTCTQTGFVRDGINLTAAQIGGTVTGTLDATGCNIGVYYGPGTSGTVSGANISGANYYGVVANAANVNVTNSSVHNIGEVPFDGTQHGVGVLYTTINQDGTSTGSSATGSLSGNTISLYQKNGVVVTGLGAAVTVTNNVVTGAGPISYIAQNGIQISFDAAAKLSGNNVSLNNYTPSKVTACGLLLYKAGGVSGATKAGLSFIKADNNFHNNETDICNFGKGGGFSPAP